MSDVLANLRTDIVTLEKKDGTQYEKIRANHKAGLFNIYAGSVPVAIEDGDYLLHQLPHGATEKYVITDHGFTSDFTGEQYNCAVRKASAPPPTSPAHNVYVVTMSGSNSRLNIGSLDQSTNIIQVDSPRDLFAEMRAALQSVRVETQLEELERVLGLMEEDMGKPSFIESYKAFMAAAADHMALLAPFLPALAQFLK